MSLPQDEGELHGERWFVWAHGIPITNMTVCDARVHVDDEEDDQGSQVIDPEQALGSRRGNRHFGIILSLAGSFGDLQKNQHGTLRAEMAVL